MSQPRSLLTRHLLALLAASPSLVTGASGLVVAAAPAGLLLGLGALGIAAAPAMAQPTVTITTKPQTIQKGAQLNLNAITTSSGSPIVSGKWEVTSPNPYYGPYIPMGSFNNPDALNSVTWTAPKILPYALRVNSYFGKSPKMSLFTEYVLTYTVTNEKGETASDSVTITVQHRAQTEFKNYPITVTNERTEFTWDPSTLYMPGVEPHPDTWFSVNSGPRNQLVTVPLNVGENVITVFTHRPVPYDVPGGYYQKTYTVTVGRLPKDQELPPEVSLSAVDDRGVRARRPQTWYDSWRVSVDEGFPVTVKATLTRALTQAVTIPLTLSRYSSEDGDHGTLASITIPAGSLSATAQIAINQDDDDEAEQFTVALDTGKIPPPGTYNALVTRESGRTASSPSSVVITINDDESRWYVPLEEKKNKVTLSVAAGRVDEGSPVTVTATLSKKKLYEAVTIPLVLTRDTSEEEDHGTLASITIPAGFTSATAEIATHQDDDTEDEQFTVALDWSDLRRGLAAGSPSSVQVTITDDDKPPEGEPELQEVEEVVFYGGEGEEPLEELQQQAAPLTVAFKRVPSEHDGKDMFWFNARFSEALGEGGTVPTPESFAVTGGTVKRVRQIEPGLWRVRIQPKNWKDVTVTLAGDRSCSAAGAVCASDGRTLSNTSTATVSGPVRIRIKGGKAKEGKDATLDFAVTLNRAASQQVTVDYATEDGTATAGADYTATSGTLTFAPGETSKTVSVPILDDAIDEGKEKFKLKLSNPQGAYLRKRHAEAVGVIRNSDPMPAAWHVRFGRTISQQVVDGLQSRFAAKPQPGLQVAVAGQDIITDTPLAENEQALAKLMGFESVSSQQLVQGSSFSFSPSADAGPQLTFWGQGALSSFQGREENLSLDGDVTTALLGAEWKAERWQAGAALSHSWGDGGYKGGDRPDGKFSSRLTGIFPYGRYAITPRLGIWATAGYGWGNLTLTTEGREYKPNANLTMAAGGMDGLLVDGGPDGLSLTTRADAMTVKTTTDKVDGVNRLASSDANVSRFRLGLEAARPFPMANGASFLPTMSIGIRQDTGDAETGFGMDLGAGISWSDPQRGISADLKGRTLISHAAEDFQDKGMTVSFSWDPTPSNRGPSLSMSHSLGAAADGGLDALLNPTVIDVLDEPTSNGRQQFETRLAYGFPAFNDRLTLTPAVGLALSQDSTTYRLLWALAPYADQPSQAEPWELSLEGQRQEDSTAASPVDHSLKLRFSLPL